MKNWEYCIVQNISGPTNQGVYCNDANGERNKLYDDSGMKNALAVLNKLGEEGWEVIAVSVEGHLTNWTLKRSK